MAVTKIIPIRTTTGKSIDYICNPNKTENCAFVHSENCFPKTASVEFSFYLRQAQAGGNTLGRHLIQSFSPDETTPEQAHEIGKKLAEQHLKGEYAYVMTTHVDRNYIHNHFVWCAVNLKTHNRYHSNKLSYHEIQDLSDTLCRENGLSVIEVKSGKRGKSRFEYDMAKQGGSYKEKLRIAIDNAALKANSFEDFLQLLAAQGYEIKQGKYLSFKHKDGERFTRAKTIGEDYTEERIKHRIKTKAPVKQSQSQQQQPSIRNLLDLSQDKFQNSKGLTHWGKIQNLKIMADTMSLLREKCLTDLTEFDRKFTAATTAFDKTSTALKSAENCLKDLTELQKQLRIYGRTKEMYGKFQQSRNKDKFIRETEGAESDIMLHETAKRYLAAYQKEHEKVPKSAELKPLIVALQKEKSTLYEQYKAAKAEQSELMKLHMNLQKILGTERKKYRFDYIFRAIQRLSFSALRRRVPLYRAYEPCREK